jgi:hypothetical protein
LAERLAEWMPEGMSGREVGTTLNGGVGRPNGGVAEVDGLRRWMGWYGSWVGDEAGSRNVQF